MPPHPLTSAQLPFTWDSPPSTLSPPHSLQPSLSTLGHGRAPPPLPPLKPPTSPELRRRIAGARRRRAAPSPSHLLGASPSFSLFPPSSSSLKKGGRPQVSPSLLLNLRTLVEVVLVPGKLIPFPDLAHCLRFEAIGASLTIEDLELSNPNACWI